ncbi:MAG: MFS transporter, partial [Staphylococcus lugdunensis]|nr:MFS transporter [Staphylococcus lugdunensis]
NNNMPTKSLKDANPLQYAAHAQQASIDGFNTSFLIGVAFAVIGLIIVPFLKMYHSESEEK